MEILLKNPRQHKIADLLWNCHTEEDADEVIATWGHEAILIRDLMILESIDQEHTGPGAESIKVLSKFA